MKDLPDRRPLQLVHDAVTALGLARADLEHRREVPAGRTPQSADDGTLAGELLSELAVLARSVAVLAAATGATGADIDRYAVQLGAALQQARPDGPAASAP